MKTSARNMILMFCLALLVVSCTWQGVMTTVKVKLLYEEFEAAAITVLDLPLPAEDRLVVEKAVADLDAIRIELGQKYEASDGELLLTVLQTETYLETIRETYQRGREPVQRYYEQNNIPVPYHVEVYDRDAAEVYATIKDQLKTRDVEIREVTEVLALVLRVLAATGGAPIP